MAVGAKKMTTADLVHVQAAHPVQRQLVWRPTREKDLALHGSYGLAAEIQMRGTLNATPCRSCAQGAGPFGNGCVSFWSGYGREGKIPFGGACACCFWGGQGSRCSLRAGGGKFLFPSLPFLPCLVPSYGTDSYEARVRVRAGTLFQDKNRAHTHLGSGFNLASTDGVRDALAELRGLEKALVARGRALEAGESVVAVSSEDEEMEDVESEGSTWEGFE